MLWILPEILSRHRRVLILRRGSKSIESSPAKLFTPLVKSPSHGALPR